MKAGVVRMPMSGKDKSDSIQKRNLRREVGDRMRRIRATQANAKQMRHPSAIIAELTRELDRVDKGRITAEAFEEFHGMGYFEAVQCWYQYHLANLQWALRSQVPLISEAECETILEGGLLP